MLAARLSPFRVAVMTCSRQNVVRPISRAVGSAPADGAAMCAANCSRGRPPLWGAQAARTFCTADHLAGQKDKDAVRGSIARILEWDFDNMVVAHGTNLIGGAKEAFRVATADV